MAATKEEILSAISNMTVLEIVDLVKPGDGVNLDMVQLYR